MEEQTNRSNKERECIEEICDAEELTEYLENLPAYSNMRRAAIKLEAKNQLGAMKRMREVAQHKKESHCPNFGYQVSIDDVNFNQDDPRVLKKAFDYDEDGYCSKPLDICQIYLDNNNARCGGKNQWCHNLNVESNNVTRGWDFYVENGLDYLGFECMCETGYRMYEGHCIKKASPCSFNPCKNQPNTKCEATNSNSNNADLANAEFYCVCNDGFERINSSAKCESVCKDGFDWNNDFGVCVQGDNNNEYDSYGQQEIENIFNQIFQSINFLFVNKETEFEFV